MIRYVVGDATAPLRPLTLVALLACTPSPPEPRYVPPPALPPPPATQPDLGPVPIHVAPQAPDPCCTALRGTCPTVPACETVPECRDVACCRDGTYVHGPWREWATCDGGWRQ